MASSLLPLLLGTLFRLIASQSDFDVWVSSNAKTYSSLEETAFRKAVFGANLARVDTHNADPTQTYQLGVNRFADLLPVEFASQYLGFRTTLLGAGTPLPAPDAWVDNWSRFARPSEAPAPARLRRGLQGGAPPPSPTPTPTSTVSASYTPTPTPTTTVSASYTPLPGASATASTAPPPSASGAPAVPPSRSASPSPTPSPSSSASASGTEGAPPSASGTASPPPTGTPTGSPTASPTGTRTPTPTPTASGPGAAPSASRAPPASPSASTTARAPPPPPPPPSPVGEGVDWSQVGSVVLPVRDQGACGSCYAFASAASVEAALGLAGIGAGYQSVQSIVDCSGSAGNAGCRGGSIDGTLNWVAQQRGLCAEAAYPYRGVAGVCAAAACGARLATQGYGAVKGGSAAAFEEALAQNPVAVAVQAAGSEWQLYASGVMTSACGTNLDHAVLLVGFGTGAGGDYYKIKNSWGAVWGEGGYIRLARGESYGPLGQCGVQSQGFFATVAVGSDASSPLPALAGAGAAAGSAPPGLALALGLGLGGAAALLAGAAAVMVARRKGRCGGAARADAK